MTAITVQELPPPNTNAGVVVVEDSFISNDNNNTDDDDESDDHDAFDAMLNRGAFLRRLRQLELEDEKLRQASEAEEASSSNSRANNNNSNSNEDTLDYDSFLQRQAFYDDYKHVNYRFLEFGPVGDAHQNKDHNPLLIEQNRTCKNKGGHVWDAGVILAEHVLHEQAEWKKAQQHHPRGPVSMIELGSGTGVTGLYVATALPGDVQMALTDLPEVMPLLQANLDHNPHCHATTTAFPLAWGSTNGYANHHYDVILGADVVAGIYDPVKLAQTIADLCRDERTLVYLAVNHRNDEIVRTFEAAMRPLFNSMERRSPVSRNKNPNVTILVATGKTCSQ